MATLMERARELKADRAKLINEAREIVDAAEERGEDFTGEEQQKYDKIMEDVDTLGSRAERLEKQDEQERLAGEVEDRSGPKGGRPEPEDRKAPSGPREYRTSVDARPGVPAIERRYEFQASEEQARRHSARFSAYLTPEQYRTPVQQRALENTDDTQGGYTTPPEQFIADLIQTVDDMVWIRGLANVMQLTSGDSMGRPSLDADPADADWTTELGTGNEDSTMAFGKRELNPTPLAKRIKVSNTLLRRSAIGIESLVRDRLAYKFGVTQEKAFLTGSGSDEPLGVFTASADGISTSRDVSTDNTTSAFTADGLINAKYSLKGAYWPRSRWVFHRDAVKMLAKLKDGDGRYLWSGSIVAGEPDSLLNVPVLVSEYAPNTFTTGLYVGILGDFSQYWIAEALDMTVQRLVELYAETNQVGFIGRMELDGMPVLEEAFARVKLA